MGGKRGKGEMFGGRVGGGGRGIGDGDEGGEGDENMYMFDSPIHEGFQKKKKMKKIV